MKEIFEGIPAIRYEGPESKNPLAFKFYDADKVVFFGGVYAGSVRGLKRAFRRVPVSAETIVATVGLSDVNDAANAEYLKSSVRRALPRGKTVAMVKRNDAAIMK